MMKIKQGEIYLADFGTKYNSELGKIRPAVVMQNNFFNKAIGSNVYRQVLVVPLSSVPIEDDYRIKMRAREKLQKDSYIIANWVCTLDLEHIMIDKGVLTTLTDKEFATIKEKICDLM